MLCDEAWAPAPQEKMGRVGGKCKGVFLFSHYIKDAHKKCIYVYVCMFVCVYTYIYMQMYSIVG